MAVGTEFKQGFDEAGVGDVVMQGREAVLFPIEEEDDIMRLFEADELLLLAEGSAVGQPIPQEADLLFFLGSVDEDGLVP